MVVKNYFKYFKNSNISKISTPTKILADSCSFSIVDETAEMIHKGEDLKGRELGGPHCTKKCYTA
jgi:hypothetical protein